MEIANNVVLAVNTLADASIVSKENVDRVFEFSAFLVLGSTLQSNHQEKMLTQITFNETIKRLKKSQREALSQGFHSRLGSESALLSYKQSPIGDMKVFRIFKEYLHGNTTAQATIQVARANDDEDDESHMPQATMN